MKIQRNEKGPESTGDEQPIGHPIGNLVRFRSYNSEVGSRVPILEMEIEAQRG